MGNQQLNCSKDEVLKSNIDVSDIKHNKINNTEDFLYDINQSYDYLKDKYDLTRDQAKRVKNLVFNKFEKSIPDGFEVCSKDSNYLVSESGEIRRKRRRNLITPHPDGKGYLSFTGTNKKNLKVHRCVAETFIKNDDPVNKTHVNHIDGNKLNNSASNLEWCTPEHNREHAVKNNLFKTERNKESSRGEKNNSAKLTNQDVINIRNCKCVKAETLADIYGVSDTTIRNILARRTWKHI